MLPVNVVFVFWDCVAVSVAAAAAAAAQPKWTKSFWVMFFLLNKDCSNTSHDCELWMFIWYWLLERPHELNLCLSPVVCH